MHVPLEYVISVTGDDKLRRAMRGIESEAKASANRVETSSRRAARAPRAAADPAVKQAARGFNEIGKAARAADYRQIRERMSLDRRAEAERIRGIKRVEAEETRAARKAQDARLRSASSIGRGVATTVGGSVKKVVGFGANALALGGGVLGGIASGEALTSAVNLQHEQRAILRNSRGAGQADAMTPEALGTSVTNTALKTGASQEGVTAGLAAFVAKTGDLKTAIANMESFAQIAVATGANVEDVFSAAADLSGQMNISGVEEMRQAFADLTFQGKKGAFELKNMASELPELAALAARMGMTGGGGIKQLGGLMQLSMKGTGSGPEASTAFQNAMNQIVNKAGDIQSGKEFGGRKVNVFEGGDPRKKLNDIPTVIADLMDASRGNLIQVNKALEIRGSKALSQQSAKYRDTYQSTKGSDADKAKAARDAVIKMMTDASETGATWKDVQADSQNALRDTSVQLEIAKTQFNAAIGGQLLPVLTRLIPKFTELVGPLTDVASAAAGLVADIINNPVPNIGALIAGKIAIDLAGAGIEAVVAAGFARIFAASAAAGGIGAVVPAAASLVGTGANAVGGALGMGAVATTGLATTAVVGAAVGAVGAAGYNAYKLYQENKDAQGNSHILRNLFAAPSRGTTREEFDARFGTAAPMPGVAAAPGSTAQAGKALEDSATKAGGIIGDAVAQKLAMVTPPNPRRTSPVLNR